MKLVLDCLMIYVFTCMVVTVVTVIQGFKKFVDQTPLKIDYGIFMSAVFFVILVSPFFIPWAVARAIKHMWKEVIDQCRLLGEDHQR